MMFDGTSSEHERNDEDNKHFEEGSLYFILVIWPQWSLIMVSTRRIKQYRISLSLSLCGIVVSGVVSLNHQKKTKKTCVQLNATPKTHFQEPTQSHGPQAIFTYPFIDSKKKTCFYITCGSEASFFGMQVRYSSTSDTLRGWWMRGCGWKSGRNFSLPELVFFRKVACRGEPKQLLYKKKIIGRNEFQKHK